MRCSQVNSISSLSTLVLRALRDKKKKLLSTDTSPYLLQGIYIYYIYIIYIYIICAIVCKILKNHWGKRRAEKKKIQNS